MVPGWLVILLILLSVAGWIVYENTKDSIIYSLTITATVGAIFTLAGYAIMNANEAPRGRFY